MGELIEKVESQSREKTERLQDWKPSALDAPEPL